MKRAVLLLILVSVIAIGGCVEVVDEGAPFEPAPADGEEVDDASATDQSDRDDQVGPDERDVETLEDVEPIDESDDISRAEIEVLVHEYVNEERVSHGLSPLSFDDDLATIARYHSNRMVTEDFVAHVAPDGQTPQDRYERFDYRCRVDTGEGSYLLGAENIAVTYYDERVATANDVERYENEDELARAVVDGWMNSEGHRENLLTPEWENEGIGVAIVEEDGITAVYVTQKFC